MASQSLSQATSGRCQPHLQPTAGPPTTRKNTAAVAAAEAKEVLWGQDRRKTASCGHVKTPQPNTLAGPCSPLLPSPLLPPGLASPPSISSSSQSTIDSCYGLAWPRHQRQDRRVTATQQRSTAQVRAAEPSALSASRCGAHPFESPKRTGGRRSSPLARANAARKLSAHTMATLRRRPARSAEAVARFADGLASRQT